MNFVVLPGLSLLGLFFLHYHRSVSQDLFLSRFQLFSDPLGLIEVVGRDRPEYDIRSSYIEDLSMKMLTYHKTQMVPDTHPTDTSKIPKEVQAEIPRLLTFQSNQCALLFHSSPHLQSPSPSMQQSCCQTLSHQRAGTLPIKGGKGFRLPHRIWHRALPIGSRSVACR